MPCERAEADLVERARSGDDVALKLLLTESRPRLCEQISRRLPSELRRLVDAEDVVQEALVEVFNRIGSFEPRSPNAFHRWLTAIAVSRLRNVIKAHRALKRGGGRPLAGDRARSVEDSTIALLNTLAGPGRTPSQSVARMEAIEAVHSALEKLPEHYNKAIWLVHIENRTVRDAAVELGRSERAVHGLCRRGLNLLRDQLRSSKTFISSWR